MGDEVLTRSKMDPIIKDLKEFITVTVKSSETVLTGKIEKLDKRVSLVEAKVDATQHYITKMEKRLDDKIDVLSGKVEVLSGRVDVLSDRVDANTSEIKILSGRVDANTSEIKILSGRVDKIGERLDDHETRSTATENKIEAHLTDHP